MKVRVQTGEIDEIVETKTYPKNDKDLRMVFREVLKRQKTDEIAVGVLTTISRFPRSSKNYPRYWVVTKSLVKGAKR